jgi:unsaturated rhamnogalacturonyl hydrolase
MMFWNTISITSHQKNSPYGSIMLPKKKNIKVCFSFSREQLNWQPRTKREEASGIKLRYPYQMWLDGLYMGDLFYARVCKGVWTGERFLTMSSINLFGWNAIHAMQRRLALPRWMKAKSNRGQITATGKSPEFLEPCDGWYAIALVDVLDYLPKDHPKRADLILIFKHTYVQH